MHDHCYTGTNPMHTGVPMARLKWPTQFKIAREPGTIQHQCSFHLALQLL